MRVRIASEPDLGRTALSREACERFGFFDAKRRPREMACRVALLELERRGMLVLPQRRRGVRSSLKARVESRAENKKSTIRCVLKSLGAIDLVNVTGNPELSSLWNDLIATHHYLGYTPLVGAQMRYLIRSEQRGWLGGLGFSASARRLADRERFIGWSEGERRAGLKFVVNNSRFLILPWVEVKNLASHVLSMASRRLAGDWQEHYGYQPAVLETFVDAEHFDGTCYRAANWIEIGQSKGRGRQDRENVGKNNDKKERTNVGRKEEDKEELNQTRISRKRIFLFPLVKDWRDRLGVRDRAESPQLRGGDSESDWAEREFGGCDLGDPRRSRRLVEVARDFYARPQATIPQACNGEAKKVKAVYRLMNNDEVNSTALLAEHKKRTVERMAEQRVVLAVQDTSTLNYTAHGKSEGIGPIGARTSPAVGLILHDTLALTPAGLTLGVLDAQVWARDFEYCEKGRPFEDKESMKWLRSFDAAAAAQAELKDTLVVSVGDREADLYELFALVRDREDGPQLLVRAKSNRLLKQSDAQEAGGAPTSSTKGKTKTKTKNLTKKALLEASAQEQAKRKLWAHMSSQEIAGERTLLVPRRKAGKGKKAQPARSARLAVRYAPVVLRAPDGKRRVGNIKLFAVYACEQDPKDPSDPIEWMLLTTLEVGSFEQACEKLDWYAQRWMIEVYHRTLKSGCRIEDRQHHSAQTLENCLAIDMVIAARILRLTWIGRKSPEMPCTIIFSKNQWQALYCFRNKTPVPCEQVPTVQEVIGWIGQLGGHLGRKCDGPPGTKHLWIGIPRMDDITQCFVMFTSLGIDDDP